MQLRLNELIAAVGGASDRLIDVESSSEDDLAVLRIHFVQLSAMAQSAADICESHSVDEVGRRYDWKHARRTAARGAV